MYPEARRFDGWREEFAHHVINSDIRRLDDPSRDRFHAETHLLSLGEIKFAKSIRTPIELSRTAAQVAESDGSVGLLLNIEGGLHVSQDGVEILNDKPGAVLTYHSRVHKARFLAGASGLSHVVAFILPRRTLLAAAPEALTRAGGRISSEPGVLKYLTRYTADFVAESSAAPADPTLAATVGSHILDLVSLMLGASRDAAEIASRRGLRAARQKSILAFVAENLGDPNLDVSMVAARHGVSTRYVSQLMEEKGETLTRCILRLRLEKSAMLLSDPALRSHRIGDIALACGFTDLSHFNRSFRRHFGETPRSYRG